MFVLSTLSDIVRIHPSKIPPGTPTTTKRLADKCNDGTGIDPSHPAVASVIQEINRKYANKVIPQLGCCIRCMDILEWTDPIVLACQNGAYQRQVTFRLVMFKPAIGSILTGRIKDSCPTRGIRVSLGFMDDIYVPPVYLMPNTTTFDPGEGLWVWKWEGNELWMDVDEPIRVRVEHEEWNVNGGVQSSATSSAEGGGNEEGSVAAPYQLLCSMTEPGLGLHSWWEDDDDDDDAGD